MPCRSSARLSPGLLTTPPSQVPIPTHQEPRNCATKSCTVLAIEKHELNAGRMLGEAFGFVHLVPAVHGLHRSIHRIEGCIHLDQWRRRRRARTTQLLPI
ncbi:hypothetical protein VTO73DRAFT_12714 [Trametes versicolor]